MKYFFLTLVICVCTVQCSPLRKINMKNMSGDNVEITWKLKDLDSLYKSPFFMSNSETIVFKLKPEEPYNTVKMSFGMGSWKRDTLAMITDRLESLEIKSASGTIRIDSSKNIYSFLLNRRKGIGKRKIEILVRS
jgi:hypothetical protein